MKSVEGKRRKERKKKAKDERSLHPPHPSIRLLYASEILTFKVLFSVGR
jgi:hypothetical protein